MNLKTLAVLVVAVLVAACNKGKDVKIIDGGAGSTNNTSNVNPVIVPSTDDTKPAPDALPEAKFCDRGQVYTLDVTVDTDLLEYKGKNWIDSAYKTHKQVKAYFQDGSVLRKDQVLNEKVYCVITAYINPKFGKKAYRISGAITPEKGEEKVEHQSICREEMIDLEIKNGQGLFTEIACVRADEAALKIEDVKDAMGITTITVSEPVRK